MIVIFLFAGALMFAISMIFVHPGLKKTIWVTVGLILTIGSIVLLTLNYNTYLGMKQVSSTTTYPLTSSIKGQKVILYQQLGTKNERIYYYQTNPLSSKLERTNPNTSSVTIHKNTNHNQLKITRSYRIYRNEEMRLLFSAGIPNNHFIGQHYQFDLKPGWTVKAK